MTTTQYLHRAQTTVATINALATKRTLAILASCLAMLAPGIVSAAKPAASVDAECVLLLSPDPVYTGSPFVVKLVRDPSYPGAFRQPTVSIDVTYPTLPESAATLNYTVTIPKFDVTYVETPSFTVPALSDGIAVNDAVVVVAATVTEPLTKKGNKVRTTVCTTTVPVMPGS
jgi:hypothetical protein